ncbi:MAG: glycosyltransferase family 2 protein [Flavobacteriales bacterium]|nr:glycosyltransferase family 2 protein [Flavobacteriales bacterium]
MPISKIDISIIIVNYKGWIHLRNCLKSLGGIHSDTFNFEVIVVDNCSNDGQLAQFILDFNGVNFYKNTGNNGFANACNLGADKAKGNYFLFLNPDTIANTKALEVLLETAIKYPDYGILSCQQYKENNKRHNHEKLFLAPSRMFGLFRVFHKLFNANKLKERFDISKEIIFPDWVSGSVIFISRDWLKKVNGWCNDYWMYYEDVDLCKKVTQAGGKIALLRTASIIHYHGGSTRINYKTKALTKSEVIISRHVYVNKYFKGFTRFFMQLVLITHQIISKLILGIFGMILFFIPKFKVNRFLAENVFKYYYEAINNKTWLSIRSTNIKIIKK